MEPDHFVELGQIFVYAIETTGGSPGAMQTSYEILVGLGSKKTYLWGDIFAISKDYKSALIRVSEIIQEKTTKQKENESKYDLVFGNHEGHYFKDSTTDGNHVIASRTLYANEKDELLYAMKAAKQK